MDAGFHLNVPDERYHADPCVVPSLNCSVAKTLLSESCRKAWFKHPRLNKDHHEDLDAKFDIGKASHSLLLEGEDAMHVVEADDWRTGAAKEARAAARQLGKLPMLAYQAAKVRQMVVAAKEFISESEIADYWRDADSEVTGICREGDVWLRCRYDRITKNRRFQMDYKSTEDSSPDAFGRILIRLGYHIQDSFYRRVARNLDIVGPRFAFVAQSVEPPYECSLHGCDPALQEIADCEVERAIQLWRECMTKKTWPSYGSRVHWAMPSNYMIQEHEMRLQEAA